MTLTFLMRRRNTGWSSFRRLFPAVSVKSSSSTNAWDNMHRAFCVHVCTTEQSVMQNSKWSVGKLNKIPNCSNQIKVHDHIKVSCFHYEISGLCVNNGFKWPIVLVCSLENNYTTSMRWLGLWMKSFIRLCSNIKPIDLVVSQVNPWNCH